MSTIKFSHYKFFVGFVKFFVKLEYLKKSKKVQNLNLKNLEIRNLIGLV